MGGGDKPKSEAAFFLSGTSAAYVSLVAYQAIMAGWASVGSKALNNAPEVPIAVFLMGRHWLACMALAGLVWLRDGSEFLVPRSADVQKITLCSLCAQYVSPVMYLYGLQFVPGTIGSLFDGPVIPLVVYVMALSVGVEQLPTFTSDRFKVLGSLSLASGGAALLIMAVSPGNGQGGNSLEGSDANGQSPQSEMFTVALVALFMESLALSASFIIGKPLVKRYRLLPYAFWMSLGGFLASATQVALYEDGGIIYNTWNLVDLCNESPTYLVALLYNAFAVGLLNTLLLAFSNALLPSSMVALAACVQPMFTQVLDVMLFDASLTGTHLFAFGCIGCGIKAFTRFATRSDVPLDSKSKKYASGRSF